MKTAASVKKFQFLEICEGDNKSFSQVKSIQSKVDYSINDIISDKMRIMDNFAFLSGHPNKKNDKPILSKMSSDISVKKTDNTHIFKIYKSKLLDAYELFTTNIYDFIIKTHNQRKILIAFGADLKQENKAQIPGIQNIEKEYISLVKFYDITKCLDTNNENEPELIKSIVIMRNNEKKTFSLSMQAANFFIIDDVNCFDVTDDIGTLGIGCNNGDMIILTNQPGNPLFEDGNYKCYSLKKEDDEFQNNPITNCCFTFEPKNQAFNLVFSNEHAIYKYRVNEKNIIPEKIEEAISGLPETCLGMHPTENKFLTIMTTCDNYINEYIHFDKGPIWGFDGIKKFLGYFKNNYILFVLIEETVYTLAVYDVVNQFFVYFNSNFNAITSIQCDQESIFILDETQNSRKIIRFKEKDNKEKFDNFYKKSFFDTALNYAKFLKYDEKKISEISKRHAEHLYKKGEYEKSIDQYIKTINYLDPSYVIQKFLDGAKLDFLIKYLEAVNKDEKMRKKCKPEEMKDYTALLLNCYIKQKKIDKLKLFVEQKDITEQKIILETAIEVCKDTKETELALNIAKKSNLTEAYIQILMDMKDDYEESLNHLVHISDKIQKFKLFLKYGNKFLEKNSVQTMDALKPLISELIKIKNGIIREDLKEEEIENYKNLHYESIVLIFNIPEKEKELDEILELIMREDENCPPLIINRKMELYLDKYKRSNDSTEESFKINDNIKQLLRNPKYQKIMDKNYLLMLFKLANYTNGITELSEIMELKQELLEIYRDNHNYDKVIEVCQKYGKTEFNYWVQALTYFIGITTESTKNYVEKYIKEILESVGKNESMSPLILFEILKKSKYIQFNTVKDLLINYLKKNKDSINEDKREVEINSEKIDKLNVEQKDLQQKAKTFGALKCSACNREIKEPPFVYFLCNHAFHNDCLNGDDLEEMSCAICRVKKLQLEQRINQSKEMSGDHNSFMSDLKGTPRKFELIAKYLGKGIFDMDKDMPK